MNCKGGGGETLVTNDNPVQIVLVLTNR